MIKEETFGVAVLKCRQCKNVFVRSPGPCECPQCKELYIDWINFEEWQVEYDNQRNKK